MAPTASGLKPPKTAPELLEMYYLEMRCHLLEMAAAMDRIERADESDAAFADPRMKALLESLELLKTDGGDRAERFLNRLSE